MMKSMCRNVSSDTLWQKILQFPIGGEPAEWESVPTSGLTFSQRLARENHWDLAKARRCIDEYRKFLFLAATAGHPVTPSDAVDQVWHQHLVYTENYWAELCQEVLPSPLHHGPTKGGSKERLHYQDQYERTLESYEQVFGMAPQDIWPPTEERFAQSIASLRIDRRRFWLIPKPSFQPSSMRGSHVAFAGLMATPVAALFPFNLDGASFLALYAAAVVAGLIYLIVWFHITNSGSSPTSPQRKLGWGELSVLMGGKRRLLQTSLVALQRRGIVNCDENGFSILDRGALQSNRDDDTIAIGSMKAITDYLTASVEPQSFQRLLTAISSTASHAELQLQESGYVRTSKHRNQFQRGVFGLAAILLGIGTIRCVQGAQNNRPIGFLILEMVVAGVAIAIAMLMAKDVRLTSQGRDAQRRSQTDYPISEIKSDRRVDDNDVDELPYLAYWGPTAAAYVLTDPAGLSTNDLLYNEEIEIQKASGSGGWSGWGGSSDGFSDFSSDSGGGAGCGGGCGGCGGCGG